MRGRRLSPPALLFVGLCGCGILGGRFANERQVCDDYLDCAADATPDAVGTLVGQYGSDSDCWDNGDQAELCATSCQSGATGLIALADDPTSCELAAAGTGEGEGEWVCSVSLTEQEFADRFMERMCTESEACGPSLADIWCDPSDPTGTTEPLECTFDRAQACACLDDAYTCNRDVAGFEFVEPAPSCLAAYDCG